MYAFRHKAWNKKRNTALEHRPWTYTLRLNRDYPPTGRLFNLKPICNSLNCTNYKWVISYSMLAG